MAIDSQIFCKRCKKQKYVTHACGTPVPEICNSCQMELKQEEKEKWLAEHRQSKTLEERVAWAEEWIYNHQETHKGPPNPFF